MAGNRDPNRPFRGLVALIRDTRAATAIEYGLVCSMIVIAAMVALQTLAAKTVKVFNNVSSAVAAH